MIAHRLVTSVLLALGIPACVVASSSSAGHVDEQLAFGDNAFATRQACLDAKERGDYPWLAACQNEILLCPSGYAETLIGGDVIEMPSYRIDADTLVLSLPTGSRTTGTLAADGSLITPDQRVWAQVDPATEPGWELGSCDAKP